MTSKVQNPNFPGNLSRMRIERQLNEFENWPTMLWPIAATALPSKHCLQQQIPKKIRPLKNSNSKCFDALFQSLGGSLGESFKVRTLIRTHSIEPTRTCSHSNSLAELIALSTVSDADKFYFTIHFTMYVNYINFPSNIDRMIWRVCGERSSHLELKKPFRQFDWEYYWKTARLRLEKSADLSIPKKRLKCSCFGLDFLDRWVFQIFLWVSLFLDLSLWISPLQISSFWISFQILASRSSLFKIVAFRPSPLDRRLQIAASRSLYLFQTSVWIFFKILQTFQLKRTLCRVASFSSYFEPTLQNLLLFAKFAMQTIQPLRRQKTKNFRLQIVCTNATISGKFPLKDRPLDSGQSRKFQVESFDYWRKAASIREAVVADDQQSSVSGRQRVH